jgi:hypothetical protein
VEISTAKMMTQHEITRDRIKAYEIGSSFFLLGFMKEKRVDIVVDTGFAFTGTPPQ